MRIHALLRKPVSLRRGGCPTVALPAALTAPAAIRQILYGPRLQPKLTVGPPDDAYEREADRVADAVMRMPEGRTDDSGGEVRPGVQRMCQECAAEENVQRICSHCAEEPQRKPTKEEEEERLQRDETPARVPEITPDLEARIHSLQGDGQPLSTSSRAFFEPRFGQDFSGVRLHTGSSSAEISRLLHAKAFTAGNHIAFGAGHYEPESGEGRRLLAHELTHVVQQGGGVDQAAGAQRGRRVRTAPEIVRRYTAADIADCACLDWSLERMSLTARAMVTGGAFSGRAYAAFFMDLFTTGNTRDVYVPFSQVQADPGGEKALKLVNHSLANQFLEEADALICSGSRTGVEKTAKVEGHFSGETDLFYAMGGFGLSGEATGDISKTCDTSGKCTQIATTLEILYRIDDLYDWKTDPGGCTPSTGERGCIPNKKKVPLPVFGVICDECLNRLVIHGWASEFMVKVRGRAIGYQVTGPCGFRNPTALPSARDNQTNDL